MRTIALAFLSCLGLFTAQAQSVKNEFPMVIEGVKCQVKAIGGKSCSSMKNVAGKWTIGGEKSDAGQKFQLSMLKLIPAEFDKLHEASSIEAAPMDVLLQ